MTNEYVYNEYCIINDITTWQHFFALISFFTKQYTASSLISSFLVFSSRFVFLIIGALVHKQIRQINNYN